MKTVKIILKVLWILFQIGFAIVGWLMPFCLTCDYCSKAQKALNDKSDGELNIDWWKRHDITRKNALNFYMKKAQDGWWWLWD